jgi:hypothetical protein
MNTTDRFIDRLKDKRIITLIIFVFIVVTGIATFKSSLVDLFCSNKKTNQEIAYNNYKKEAKRYHSIINDIYIDIYLEKATQYFLLNLNTGLKIIGITGKRELPFSEKFQFKTLDYFGDKWSIGKTILYGDDFTYKTFIDTFQTVTISNRDYLYFVVKNEVVGTAAAGLAALDFCLFDGTNDSLIILTYDSYVKNDKLEGEFVNIQAIKNTDIIDFFNLKAKECKVIFRPSNEDFNLADIKNYEKKFQLNNPKLKDINYLDFSQTDTFHVDYYEKNIFPDSIYYDELIENKNLKVVSLFRNNVLGYDKLKKRYFPILILSCNHGCEKKIKFIDNWKLMISFDYGDCIIFDFEHMRYKGQKCN